MTNQELLEEIKDFATRMRERAQEDVEDSDEEIRDFYRGKREAYRRMVGFIRFLETREEGEND